MTIEQKIRENLIYDVGAKLSKVHTTLGTNNDGEHLYYIKAIEKESAPSYARRFYIGVTYYAFDEKGNTVTTVLVKVSSLDKVELEYGTEPEYQNKGNVTLLAREAMRDVFEKHILDGLRIERDGPRTQIELMEVQIHYYNLPSLRVAETIK